MATSGLGAVTPHYWRDNYQQCLNWHRLIHHASLDRTKVLQLMSGSGAAGAGAMHSLGGTGSPHQVLARDLLTHMNSWHHWVCYWRLTFAVGGTSSSILEDLTLYVPPELTGTPTAAKNGVNLTEKLKGRSLAVPFANLHVLHGLLRWTKVLLSVGLCMCHLAAALDNMLLRQEQDIRATSKRHNMTLNRGPNTATTVTGSTMRVLSWHNLLSSLSREATLLFPVLLQREVETLNGALVKMRSLASLCTRATSLPEAAAKKQMIHDCYLACAEMQRAYCVETFRLPPEVHDQLTAFDEVTAIIEGSGRSTVAPENVGEASIGTPVPGMHFNSSTFKSLVSSTDPFSLLNVLTYLLSSRGLLGGGGGEDVSGGQAMTILSTPRIGLTPATAPVHAVLETATSTVVQILYEAVERYPNNAVGPFGMIPMINDVLHFLSALKVPYPCPMMGTSSETESGSSNMKASGGGGNQHRAPPTAPPQPNVSTKCSPHNMMYLLPKIAMLVGIACEKLCTVIEERVEEALVGYQANTQKKSDEPGAGEPGVSQDAAPTASAASGIAIPTAKFTKNLSSAMWNIVCSIMEPIVNVLSKMDHANPALAQMLLGKLVSSILLGLEGVALRGGEAPSSASYGLMPGATVTTTGQIGVAGGVKTGGVGKPKQPGPRIQQAKEDINAIRKYLTNHPRLPDWLRQHALGMPVWSLVPQ